jgi:hypothetical protein
MTRLAAHAHADGRVAGGARHSSFVIRHSFVILVSSFVIHRPLREQ